MVKMHKLLLILHHNMLHKGHMWMCANLSKPNDWKLHQVEWEVNEIMVVHFRQYFL